MDRNYYPTYTEDITVAGALLADKIQTLCEHFIGKPPLQEMDLAKLPNLRLKVEKVQLIDRFGSKVSQSTHGTLYITTSHVIFVSNQSGKEIWVLHSHVASVERGSLSAAGCPLTIKCKHFLVLPFLIARDKECQDVLETLLQLSQPVNVEDVYAFNYVPATKELEKPSTCANVADEYHRMGIPNNVWTISDFNENYAHCDTYPQKLVVPTSAAKQILIGSCRFRSRGRLPVLSYYHSASQAAICRCSQPLSGFSARCVEDESMMECIQKTNTKCNVLYVIDTRPKVNAMVNKAQGKGWEDERNYSNIKFHFCAIDNIHVMRSSLQKLAETCAKPVSVTHFLKGVDDCGWLKHVRLILETGAFIVDSICRSITCVVHCSDGWDRTAQTITIAMLLLDPYYRTMDGFRALVEKDWLSFGHKFSDRCGHAGGSATDDSPSLPGTGTAAAKEMSPVFTQFLDCVWQLMEQFPRAFEFRENYLIELHDHVHSCQFGTFLGNCDKDRKDLRLAERTYCMWSYIDRKRSEYINPIYNPEISDPVLVADTRGFTVRFWRGMYNRFDAGIHPRESVLETGTSVREHVTVLQDHLQVLHSRVCELRQLLGKGPLTVSAMIDSGHSSGSCLTETDQALAKSKSNSEPESGVDEPHSPPSTYKSNGRHPLLSQLSQVGMMESLTSLDLSSTDLSAPEIASVAVRWQSLRKAPECSSCRVRFGYAERKCHCFKCGLIFCRRCLCPFSELPGLSTQLSWPLCKNCSQDLNLSSPLLMSSGNF